MLALKKILLFYQIIVLGWGITYDKFGLKYTTPTVGLIITPYDYIKFLKKLDYYLSLTPEPYDDQPNDEKLIINHIYIKLIWGTLL